MNEKELIEKITKEIYRIDEGVISIEDAISEMKSDGTLKIIDESFKAGQEDIMGGFSVVEVHKDLNRCLIALDQAKSERTNEIITLIKARIDELDIYFETLQKRLESNESDDVSDKITWYENVGQIKVLNQLIKQLEGLK